MKRQNNDELREELDQLNNDLNKMLDENLLTEKEQDFEAIDVEEPDEEIVPVTKKAVNIVTGVLAGILGIMIVAACVFVGMRSAGKKSLEASADLDVKAPNLAGQDVSVENNGEIVIYNGQKYRYNHNIITVLCMGVDMSQTEAQEEHVRGGNGQADTIILAVLDAESGKCSLLNISRDSMVDIDRYSTDGNYAGTKKGQITLSYSYGDGKDSSCINTARSVSRLLYGIPVSSYAAINLSAINVLNDAIGGVEVEVLEDLTLGDPELEAGKKVTLKGEQAELYVRSRDAYSGDANSNTYRMDRQKQYLSAFARKTLEQSKEDITVPMTLFDVASDYMVTDLNAARVSYLVSLMNKIGFDESRFMTVPGEAKIGEGGYAEYYVDDQALYEMVLELFYKKDK